MNMAEVTVHEALLLSTELPGADTAGDDVASLGAALRGP